MADKRIDQLAEVTDVADADLFVLEHTGVAKKVSGATVKGFVGQPTQAQTDSAVSDWMDEHAISGTSVFVYVYGDTLFINSDVQNGNEVYF